VNTRELNRATLSRQMLLGREAVKPLKAIERLAGMQAQVPKPPFLGLWSRIDGFRREDLRKLVEKRQVVRATMMRATLHLVSTKDFLAWRMPLQPMLDAGRGAITKDEPLDLEALVKIATKFFDEEPRPFEALRAELAARFPATNERLMAYAVRMHLPLAMVPDDSTWSWPSDSAFAVAETFLGKKIARDGDLKELVRRYLAAFGPATPGDFQTWSGLTGARPVFEELRPELVTFKDGKRELFDVPDAPRPGGDVDAPVRFLPDYDNVRLAWSDRSRIIADEHLPLVATRNLRVLPTFLVDGFVAGTWSITRKTKSATLALVPFGKVTRKVRDELAAEGEALLRFAEEDAREFVVKV
jgi:hypothetical protein